jgi:ABC-type lipoprotein export system ATPase subunit
LKLSDKIDEPIKYLSGGQQRRVAIARTMAQGAKLILADEFLSELDDKTANNVWNVMYDYVKANQITLIIVEHNIERAKLADRCFKLQRSKNAYSTLVEVEK